MHLRVRRPTLSRAPRAGRRFASLVAVLAAAVAPAAPAQADTGRIVNGVRASINEVPWQVNLWSRGGLTGGFDCGGVIIDASTIVTAAHCVDGVALGADPTDGGLGVTAGMSDVSKAVPGDVVEHRTVVDARIHPQWDPDVVRTAGDLAVLDLDVPLVFGNPNVKPIALPPDVPLGEQPAFVGTSAIVSGYGRQWATLVPTGELFKLATTVEPPGLCGGADNAAALCARAPSGAACAGDSGGPLVSPTSPPVLIGIVSNGPTGCPGGEGESYVNLAAPENRRFLAGDANPPIAPRVVGDLVFAPVGGSAVVIGQPVVCSVAFSGAAGVRWTISDDTGRALAVAQGGTGATYWPTESDVGRLLSCEARASNAGGVAVAGPASTTEAVSRPRISTQVKTPDPSAFTLDGAALTASAARKVKRGRVMRAKVELSQLFGVAESATVCVRFAKTTEKCVSPAVKSLQGASYAFRVRVPRNAKVGSRQRLTATATLHGRDSSGQLRQVNRATSLKLRIVR